MDAQIAIKRAAEEAQEAMAELLVWQQEQNAKDAELRRQAAAERRQKAASPLREAAKPAAAPPDSNGRHGKTQWGGPKVEGCIIEDVTEDQGTEAGNQQPPRQPLPKQQPRSAAQHTYEHYSRRWERFDADAAVRSDDESEGERPSAAAPKPATGRIQGGAGASAATATDGSPPTPSAQPVLPPRQRAAKRAGAVEAGSAAGSGAEAGSAEEWRERGNARFKAGDYAGAREAYTASLAVSPTCLAHANRAMAALKMGDAESAEVDSTAAIGLDATYIKAYQRRAAARQMQGRQLEAIDDLETALRLQPTSAALAKERADAVTAVVSAEGLTPSATQASVPVTLAGQDRAGSPEAQLPPAAAALPLAPSTEVSPSAGVQPPAASQPQHSGASILNAQQSPPAAAEQPATGVELRPAASRRLDASQGAQRGPPAAAETYAAAVSIVTDHDPAPPAEVAVRNRKAPEAALVDRVSVQQSSVGAAEAAVPSPASASAGASNAQQSHAELVVPPQGHAPWQNGASRPHSPREAASEAPERLREGRSQQASVPGSSAALPMEDNRLPAAADLAKRKATLRPATSGQEFERNWRTFKGALPLQQAYLQLLDPAALPAVFKSSLTPALLGDCVLCLLKGIAAPIANAENGIAEAAEAQIHDAHGCVRLLEGFASVPRFSMMKIAISSAQKAAIRSAWEDAATAVAESADAPQFARLQKLYGL